jgi:uncharacterized membrane protein YqjE
VNSGGGLFAAARGLLASSVALVSTRLELIALELDEAGQHLRRSVFLGVVALLAAALGLIVLNILLVAAFWEQRVWVLSLLLLVYLGIATVAVFALREHQARRRPLFTDSVAELRRDHDRLRGQ